MGKPSMQGGKKGSSSSGGKADPRKDQKTKGASSSAKASPKQATPDVVFSVFDAKAGLDLTCRDGSKIDSKESLLDVLRADCVRAFTAKGLSEGEDNYSTGSTFFIPAEKAPENGLESLALQIFRKHTEGKSFDAKRSGAEWWTQVIDAEDDIGAHWDRDYDLEEEEGVHMYPNFGTVSYFTDVGAPTLVVDAVGTASADDDIQGEFSRVTLCHPQTLRHLRFDGRLFHAAPADLLKDDDSEEEGESGDEDEETDEDEAVDGDAAASDDEDEDDDEADSEALSDDEDDEAMAAQRAAAVAELLPKRNEKRITFLVNIWLDHVPSQGTPLPDDIAASLQCPVLSAAQLELLSPEDAALSVRRVEVGTTDRVKMLSFLHSDFLFDVAIPLPDDVSALEAAAQDKAIVELRFTSEMKPVIMLNEVQEMLGLQAAAAADDDEDDDEEDEEEEEEEKPLPPAKKQRRG